MTSDSEGFLTPQIDSTKCVECGLCEKACPVLNPPKLERDENPDVYACWNNDDGVRSQSASGGMFSVYARQIIENGGVVFGVAFDQNMTAVFVKAETVDELQKLRSSKYVQADTGLAYRDVETELKRNRKVLFTGTPCQVAGLYSFLQKNDSNLFTCDLVCHGVPSPGLFEKWIRYLEKKYAGKVVGLNFRGKQDGDSHLVVVTTDTNPAKPIVFPWNTYDAAYVGRMFGSNICLRSSCYACPFRFPRVADITLGDFWGIEKQKDFPYPTQNGVSLNLINDEQGKRLVEQCRNKATFVSRTLNDAALGNPCLFYSVAEPLKRAEFLRDLKTLDYERLTRKYRKELFGTWRSKARGLLIRILLVTVGTQRVKRMKKLLKTRTAR